MPWLVPLPVQPTPLLGRARELEIIRRQLVDADARLLTLTGPPGVGKTRLALEAGGQVADRFPDGVTFIDLALVRDPARVLPMIAQALGIANRDGDPLLERLEAHLRDMRVLLILDIFERVLPAAIQLADLLATCPGLTMLVTSRIPLHLRWEQTLSIEPLTVPDLTSLPALEELAAVPAVALFLQRVLAVNSDLTLTADNAESVAQLVIHLDGLPLAIELAAARTPLLSPQMIVERLEQRLSLLHWEAPDIPERQHSLGSAVGWSYDLLDADDQALFRQLAVFAGGFDLEGAEGVVSVQPDGVHDVLQGLGSLVDKSLIQVKRQGEEEVRFELLESIREYALQQLDGHGELDSAARAHARYFLQLAEQADPHLRIRDQLVWYLRLDQECDNSRAALRWLLDHDEHESALRLAAALGFYWWTRGQGSEGWRWLAEAMEKAPGAAPALRTKALLTAGAILINEGNLGRSKGLLEEAGSLARARQDSSGVAEHLTYLGAVATFAGESTESARLLPQALSRWEELGNHFYIGLTLWYQAGAALMQGANEQASSLFSHALLQYDVIGDARMSSVIHLYLGLAMLNLDDRSQAVQYVHEGIRMGRELEDGGQLRIGVHAALILAGDGVNARDRAQLLGAEDTLRRRAGVAQSVWERITGPSVTTLRGQLEREGGGVAYREGRSLSFDGVTDLVLATLEDYAQTLAAPETTQEDASPHGPLSARELEVLHLVAEGLSSKAIGKQLFITASTVNYHLTSIFNKLGVDTRAQAVAAAARRNLL